MSKTLGSRRLVTVNGDLVVQTTSHKLNRSSAKHQLFLLLSQKIGVLSNCVQTLFVLERPIEPGPVGRPHDTSRTDCFTQPLHTLQIIPEGVFRSIVPHTTRHRRAQVEVGMLPRQ